MSHEFNTVSLIFVVGNHDELFISCVSVGDSSIRD